MCFTKPLHNFKHSNHLHMMLTMFQLVPAVLSCFSAVAFLFVCLFDIVFKCPMMASTSLR